MELTTTAVLIIGLARREFLTGRKKTFLCAGVILAQVTFIMLSFGQRLTHQFDSAGYLFIYAVLTYLGGRYALAD